VGGWESEEANVSTDMDQNAVELGAVGSDVQAPRRVGMRRWEARITPEGTLAIPAGLIAPLMAAVFAWWREHPDQDGAPQPSPPFPNPPRLPPDAYVDQRDPRVPRQVYLRLAREGAFPSAKVGKRILAKWADVEAALAARRRKTPTNQTVHASDDLDGIRGEMGLAPRRSR
jgi:hypothetical protein